MTRQGLDLYLMERLWQRSECLRTPVSSIGVCAKQPHAASALQKLRPQTTVIDLMQKPQLVEGVYAAAFTVERFSWKKWLDTIQMYLTIGGYLQGMTLAPGSLIELGQESIWPSINHWVKLLHHEGWGETVLDQQTLLLEYQTEKSFWEDIAVLFPQYNGPPQQMLTLELLFFYGCRAAPNHVMSVQSLRSQIHKTSQLKEK